MSPEQARRILRRAGIRTSRDLDRWIAANAPDQNRFSALRMILGHGAYVDGRWLTTAELTAWMLPFMQPDRESARAPRPRARGAARRAAPRA